MMKANARMFLLIGAMLALILVAQLTLFVANLKTRRKAESLLASLRTLEVGTSTFDDVQPILVAFNAEKMSFLVARLFIGQEDPRLAP